VPDPVDLSVGDARGLGLVPTDLRVGLVALLSIQSAAGSAFLSGGHVQAVEVGGPLATGARRGLPSREGQPLRAIPLHGGSGRREKPRLPLEDVLQLLA